MRGLVKAKRFSVGLQLKATSPVCSALDALTRLSIFHHHAQISILRIGIGQKATIRREAGRLEEPWLGDGIARARRRWCR